MSCTAKRHCCGVTVDVRNLVAVDLNVIVESSSSDDVAVELAYRLDDDDIIAVVVVGVEMVVDNVVEFGNRPVPVVVQVSQIMSKNSTNLQLILRH